MDRLSRVLMDLDAVPVQEPPIAEPSEEIVEKIPETVEVPEEDADEEEDATFNDAYIDSILCTSCQECILINPRLFKYDANKQAFITDPENGTYEELVKAAEKCPARCIHPGLPIAGDETANEGLIGRAAKFN
jgi:ferredoxin